MQPSVWRTGTEGLRGRVASLRDRRKHEAPVASPVAERIAARDPHVFGGTETSGRQWRRDEGQPFRRAAGQRPPLPDHSPPRNPDSSEDPIDAEVLQQRRLVHRAAAVDAQHDPPLGHQAQAEEALLHPGPPVHPAHQTQPVEQRVDDNQSAAAGEIGRAVPEAQRPSGTSHARPASGIIASHRPGALRCGSCFRRPPRSLRSWAVRFYHRVAGSGMTPVSALFTASAFTGLAASFIGTVSAQVVAISAEPVCATGQCHVALSDSVFLTGIPADVENRLVRDMVRDPKSGILYALFERAPDAVYVFDSTGRHSNTLEPRGNDPNTYITRVDLDSEGRLQIVDRGHNTRMVLDSRSADVIEQHTIETPGRVWDIVFGPSVYVASGPIATRDAAGFPLHAYDYQGRWQLSFGVIQPAFRGDLMPLLLRWVTPADSSSFWATPMNEYRLQRWTFDGRKLAELAGERRWFTPWVRPPPTRSLDHAPYTYVAGMTSDNSGRLWILFAMPAPEWREALDTLRDQMGNRMIRPGARYRDSVVELVDPSRGILIASARLQGSWSGFADSRHLWRTWIDAGGKAHTIVVAVGLSQTTTNNESRQ